MPAAPDGRGHGGARIAAALLALLPLAAATEPDPNAVQPAAAALLRDAKRCVAFAEEAGREILARGPSKDASVYSGDAGVAILFTGLYRATRKTEWLDAARQAIDRALAATVKEPGLYDGRAGIGQACLDLYRASGDKSLLAKARACAKGLDDPPAADVIAGAAGIGIFQLNLHAATGEKEDLEAARRTGAWLREHAVADGDTLSWNLGTRPWTGFAHGAAGISYFLLALSRATGDAADLDAAERAARFVTRNAMPEGDDGWLWHRTVPPMDGDEIRIQWCHGPPGNGLLFAAFVRAGKDAYRPALDRCLATTLRLGRTARVGGCQCHGVSGNAELLLEAYRLTKDRKFLDEARRWGSALLVPKGDGFALDAHYNSSYMLGLAGIGHFFLRLADPEGTPLPLMVTSP